MNPPGPTARSYIFNGAALLVFLALTICSAYLNLGPFNTIVAMAISVTKGALIVLFLEPQICVICGSVVQAVSAII